MRFTIVVLLSVLTSAIPALAGNPTDIPAKTIRIHNNLPVPLFPIIETAMTGTDEWLQGAFGTRDVARERYAHSRVYRVYVAPEAGIAPGAGIALRVPFHSRLVEAPDPLAADQYIDWWNGGRLYLYDRAAAVGRALAADRAHPVSPVDPGIACPAESPCAPLAIYAGTAGLPVSDPSQLAEFTFADVVTADGPPYRVDMSRVDYDISYVDQVYLPVAMAPLGNPDVGYIGTVQGLTGFRAVLTRFLADRPGWPTYRGDPPYPGPRIPGAYNVLVGGPDLTAAGATVDAMRALYAHCTTAAGDDEPCPAIRAVDDLFRRNYAHYLTLDCAPHATLTADSLLRHVHGWVPFNRNCTGGAAANPLQETPGVDYPAAVGHYLALQYLPSGAFNPYVGLIHDAGYLGMSAYAFSIDDAVGNMNQSGDGLIVVVGGPQGLVNPRPYDRKALIHVNLGQPGSGRPAWTDYGICTDRPDRAINPAFPSFQVATVAYPCTISLSDSRDRVYRFVIANPPPDPAIRCDAGATGNMLAWCRAVTPDGDGTAWYLDTPPPLD